MISNSLVAISGALFTQYIKIIDLSSSVGTIVIGLASIIFGMGISKRSRTINYISIVIIGSIVYYIVINFALNSSLFTDNLYYLIGLNDKWINILSIKPTDVKIITAIFLALILAKKEKNHAKIVNANKSLLMNLEMKKVFSNLNFEANKNDFITIIGSNGALHLHF